MQRLLNARPELRDRPVAIAQPGTKRGALIRLCCPQAMRAGVRPGMPVAEAKAVALILSVHDEDLASDRRMLEKLASWADRYSPIVGLEEGDAPECLFLDITGCADCFHGEDRLAERVLDELHAQGWTARVGIASTVGAAWGICHCLSSFSARRILRALNESELRSLPIAALRLPVETLDLLAALGIEHIEQLLQMSRGSLTGRVDPLVLHRLDQMLGRIPELIVPCKPPRPLQVRCSFEYATDRRALLHHALDRLLERITEMLCKQQLGVRHLECWLFHESEPPSRVDVRLYRPTQSLAHLRKLLDTRIEHLRLPAPVCGICLRAPSAETIPERQYDLFAEEKPRDEELAVLIDRLVSRLGREAVTFATLVADPQPEYACQFDPAVHERREAKGERRRKGKKSAACGLALARPQAALAARPSSLARHPVAIEVTVLTTVGAPRQFQHAGKEHVVMHSWGPERIDAGWWRGQDVQRDYYIVETDAGVRWWIFRCRREGRWFIHGCFE